MKLPDVNLLVYAVDESSRHHARVRPWLEQALSGTEEVGFAWMALLGFLRISTNPVAFGNALSTEQALEFIDSWLGSPVATVVHPSEGHANRLRNLLTPLGTAGNLTTDAHLAALAIEHGAELCSSDNDFARFEGLRWFNPLAA
ncbi:MAG TPA: type II toxin-antitoxin system VapC family toxin [Solirubrobacterales bacterium]|nr:type II toxin-antitoxin system VapC family toxin [Solirubrobacterales bacterium]